MPLEELCWLLRMAAHVVADSGEGETPLAPVSVATAAASADAAERADPLEAVSHALLAVGGLCLDERMKSAASPRCVLCEAVSVTDLD